MASKDGSFLRKSDRQKILRDLQQKGELDLAPKLVQNEAKEAVRTLDGDHCKLVAQSEQFGTGCLACGEDDDHANLLLCEACNAEYHTYCLEPPLRSVPNGDWYCAECKGGVAQYNLDGLDSLVDALSPCFTSRFGEVIWAQGGQGFGWWPAFIYDPRLTIGSARELARKNLGKRHLVYFFECHDAPFSVLPTSKITKWEDGLVSDFHLGKTARSAGKKRSASFQQALQAATIESQKPIEMRMDWNHSEQPQILPSPTQKNIPPTRKRRRRQLSPVGRSLLQTPPRSRQKPRSKPRGFPLLQNLQTESEMEQVLTKRNLSLALEGLSASASRGIVNPIVELSEDAPIYLKLLQKTSLPIEDSAGRPVPSENGNTKKQCKNVGFIKLSSHKSSTFADARAAILEDTDIFASGREWNFFVPGLGPMSRKQETDVGPIYAFLRQTTTDQYLGNGTLLDPLKVFLIELEKTPMMATTPVSASAVSSQDTIQQQDILKN